MTPSAQVDLRKLFPGNSELAGRMREIDWAKTPLGPVERWPASLSSTLSLCLTARFPMAIYWGSEGLLLYNDAWRPILGDKHPAALGRTARQVWPEIWDVIAPLFKSVLSTGEATWRGDALLPMHRFGYTEECYFDYTFNPIHGQSGNVEGILNVVQETTYRILNERRARLLRELALRCASAKSEKDLGEMAMAAISTNNADIPFALFYQVEFDSGNARLIQATGLAADSPARLESIDLTANSVDGDWSVAAALRGTPITIDDLGQRFGALPGGLWPEPTTQALALPITPAGQEGVSALLIAGINPRHSLDGDYRLFLDSVAAHIATALANARAYEEERKRIEAMAEIDRAKTAFFSNVSHEFRTPLTLILGPMEEMLSGALGETTELQRAHLETLRRNAVRLQKLVNTLLDYARVEGGRIQASYEPVDIALLTRELASTFCSAIHRVGILFMLNCPALDEPVYIDREMWEKIVLNLLSNALKFTLEGSIEVSLRSSDERVVLSVRDTGVGIPEEELPRLFDRFHRAHSPRARTQEGSGIGLALVQELVKLHGGIMEVESASGKGTTFTVSIHKGFKHLPQERISAPRTLGSTTLGAAPYLEEALRWLPDGDRMKPSPLSIGAPSVTAPASVSPSSERILVVDDNMDMRNYLRRLLEPHWNVRTTEDGAKALAAAREKPPDLIMTDVMMPDVGGFELLRKLRSDPRTQTIPLILLSGRAGEEAYVEGMNAGADDYVVKPFGARELLARVKARLEIARVRRDAEQRVTAILESITDGFLVVDARWRLTYMNSEAKRVLAADGLDAASLIGRHLLEEIFAKAEGSEIAKNLRRAMTERVPLAFERYYRPWDRWYSNRVYPLPDGGLAYYFQDITETKQTEEKLRASEERYRTLFESIDEGFCIIEMLFDVDGKPQDYRFVDMNPMFEKMTGLASAEGRNARELNPALEDWWIETYGKVALTGKAVRFEHHSESMGRWFDVFASRYGGEASRNVAIVFNDISDRKRAEEVLKEANRHKDEFLANMSHEIRSPMTGIMGFSDILLMKLQDPDDIECVKTIKESGKYLIEIIDDILDLSKIEAGKLKLQKESVSLATLLAEIHALLEIRAKDKKLPLILKYDGPVPETIETDRTRLRQIIVNLLSNAIKFTDQGSVQIVARLLPADLLQIDVVDTGIGISPAQQRRLFQPFSQADSSSTREFGGTGLGLAITKRLVDMLDGYISFETEVGKGSVFHVIIPTGPVRGSTVSPAGMGISECMETAPSLGCRVLIVDDRPEIRYLIGHFISEAGGSAVGVADGDAAMQAIRESGSDGGAFDVVFMDIQMPDIDGYQVTRRLRSEGFRKPIIALTASAMKGEREKCMEAGCDDYLTKPIDRQRLVEILSFYERKEQRDCGS